MTRRISAKTITTVILLFWLASCKVPELVPREVNKTMPRSFSDSQDTANSASIKWREFFSDPVLIALIDTALSNNQELNITLQEIEISKNEVMARKGEYLPFVSIGGGAGFEKEGRFTRHGAVDENIEIKPGKRIPEILPDFKLGVYASWELDVWKKLRNAKKAAGLRYLSSIEGRNFMVTNLISEIAVSYYELMALDNLLSILYQNIEYQDSAFQTIKKEKEAAKASQLAVNRFEAQLLHTQNLEYEVQQKIVETENRINFLTGRFRGKIPRNSSTFSNALPASVKVGLPSQLLVNRPDIHQAELELEAAKLDTKIARANFYPSIGLSSGIGLQSFNPVDLFKPESLLFNLAGDLVAPLVNKNSIKATYRNANAKQIQAIYNFERTLLKADLEVVNQLTMLKNYTLSYETKMREADILTQSIRISNSLFRSARADYIEVLTTQREALESRIDLVEIKLKQLEAKVNIYRALGGGWN